MMVKILKSIMLSFVVLLVSCNDDFTNDIEDEHAISVRNPFVDLNTSTEVQAVLPLVNNKLNYELIFTDEFEAFDRRKWEMNNSFKSRASRINIGVTQWFWRPSNVSYSEGNLVLKSSKENSNTMFCGAVYSNNLYEFSYGYVETKIKIAETDFGTHTAFWLQGDNMGNVDDSGADGAEIDVFESAWLGDYTKSVIHIDGYGAHKSASTKKWDAPNIHEGYHIYGLLWTPTKMEVYYDSELKITYTGKWIPKVNEFLWLSTGASFGGVATFKDRSIGAYTEAKVDYIRVWQHK